MKKHMSLFACALAAVVATPAMSATNYGARAASSADLSGLPAVRERQNVNYNKYQTRSNTTTYRTSGNQSAYYTQPARRSDLYKQYENANTSRTVQKTRSETYRTTAKRKYFLAHPFFQPVEGKFGSITDLSLNSNSFDITTHPVAFTHNVEGADYNTLVLPDTGSWKTDNFSVKEDFSFGITERIAVVGMLKYDASDYELAWDSESKIKNDDNGINLYGIGAQWRFVDNEEWIATASAYFQHQKDTANNFILDLKAGYKVAHTTIYGLGRAWYVDIDGDSVGFGVVGVNENGNQAAEFIVAHQDSTAMYLEAGAGVFSVLDQDWTLNLEATFSHYDWHNQFALRGAFGWQPNDWFALNIYGKIALHDSMDGQKLAHKYFGLTGMVDSDGDNIDDTAFDLQDWVDIGTAEIDNYKETSVGVQAIFMF